MKIWTHEICYCKYESGFTIQSVHSERILALRAMLAKKRASVEERMESRLRYGKRRGNLYEVQPDFDGQAVRPMVVDSESREVGLVIMVQHRDW